MELSSSRSWYAGNRSQHPGPGFAIKQPSELQCRSQKDVEQCFLALAWVGMSPPTDPRNILNWHRRCDMNVWRSRHVKRCMMHVQARLFSHVQVHTHKRPHLLTYCINNLRASTCDAMQHGVVPSRFAAKARSICRIYMSLFRNTRTVPLIYVVLVSTLLAMTMMAMRGRKKMIMALSVAAPLCCASAAMVSTTAASPQNPSSET